MARSTAESLSSIAKPIDWSSDEEYGQSQRLKIGQSAQDSPATRKARAIGWEVARRSVSTDPTRSSQIIFTPRGLALDEDSSSTFVSAAEELDPSDNDEVDARASGNTNKLKSTAMPQTVDILPIRGGGARVKTMKVKTPPAKDRLRSKRARRRSRAAERKRKAKEEALQKVVDDTLQI